MSKENIFEGGSHRSKLVWIVYTQFRKRNAVTYQSVMDQYNPESKDIPVSCRDDYGELKKAFRDVISALESHCGAQCIEVKGNNRTRVFYYVGQEDDPLCDLINAKVRKNLEDYWQFCQDSEGFFPTSWLDYFFQGTRDLFNIKDRRKNGEQVLSASIDRSLKNIDLLPQLYMAIKKQLVLSIEYKSYDKPAITYIVHPHYLKEYNGRWFLLSHVEGKEPDNGYNLPLDRIEKILQVVTDKVYQRAPKGFYTNYFERIVGVTHENDSVCEEIRIRAYDLKIFKLNETKKLHPSQRITVPFGLYDDGEYGEFTLDVEVNNELLAQILHYGEGLEVLAPAHVRSRMAEKVSAMQCHYLQDK